MGQVFPLVIFQGLCRLLIQGFPGGSVVNPSATPETWVQSLGWDNPLEKETATHSSILAWEIQQTGEPGRLQSMGCEELDTTQQLHLLLTCLQIFSLMHSFYQNSLLKNIFLLISDVLTY